MDDSLKDLLEAETRAESIVTEGEKERDRIIQQAIKDAQALEQQFTQRLPETQHVKGRHYLASGDNAYPVA